MMIIPDTIVMVVTMLTCFIVGPILVYTGAVILIHMRRVR